MTLDQVNYRKLFFIILIFIFLFRLPSVFIEKYDTDELFHSICANAIIDGATPYVGYVEQKTTFLQYFYAIIFLIFGKNNLYAVHFFAIFFVIFTCYYLYRSCYLLILNKTYSLYAMIAYGVFVTAFDESFMATNGELAMNLPVSISLYYFCRFYFTEFRKLFYLFVSAFFILIAFMFKQQAGIFLAVLLVFLFIEMLFYRKKENFRYIFYLAFYFIFLFFLFYFFMYLIYGYEFLEGLYYWAFIFPLDQRNSISDASWGQFFYLFFTNQGQLIIIQLVLWIALFSLIRSFFSVGNSFKFDFKIKSRRLFLIIFFIFSYIPILIAGVRFHDHYFMQYLPALSLIFAFEFYYLLLYSKEFVLKVRKYIYLMFFLPVLFFTFWHWSDVYSFHFREYVYSKRNPGYLFPDREYINLIKWIKNNTDKDDRLYVWGDGPDIQYYSGRDLGARFFDFSFLTLDFVKFFDSKKGRDDRDLISLLDILISDLEDRKTKYFIDLSPSGVNGSGRYPISRFDNLYSYVSDKYNYLSSVDNFNIWIRDE